jgi:uncharacterized Fe-S cluster-containing MiaB family protein
VCSQVSIAETSVGRQRLTEKHFRDNKYARINQRVAWKLVHVSWQQNNRGMKCPTACSIFDPHEVSSVKHPDREFESASND